MVAPILTLLALATGPVSDTGAARVEVRISATIVRATTLNDLRREIAEQRSSRIVRRCPPIDAARPECRLVVIDLP